MEGDEIVHLAPGDTVRPRGLRAGWDRFRVLHLDDGETERLDETLEHALYVIRGIGEARADSATIDLHAGTALTLVRGTGASVTAGAGGLEVFLITVQS